MSNSRKLGIAIVGGGLTGCLAALEFADYGHSVVLYEKQRKLMSRATTANEGKVHLGYVYAADRTFNTASRLIDDALLFRASLLRWISPKDFHACLYDNFTYIVPRSSKLSMPEIENHFNLVDNRVRQRKCNLGLDYLGHRETPPYRNSDAPKNALGCLETHEKGIWPRGLAERLLACVATHPRLTLAMSTSVDRIVPVGERWNVVLTGNSHGSDGPFDIVVNASWANRRNIDRKSGFPDESAWFTRLKLGVLLKDARMAFGGAAPVNVTAISGAFGDSVYFPQNDTLYTCWYPVGRCYSTGGVFADGGVPEVADKEAFVRRTWSGYASIDPYYRRLDAERFADKAEIIGDFIVARGSSDIDDLTSELHVRLGQGPHQLSRGYWTLDTGKFTSAPRCALDCVRQALDRY